MNKLKLFPLLAVMLVAASCSSDDQPTNLAAEAIGDYAGYTVASCNYFSGMVASDQNVTITSSEVNKANISYQSSTWGTITIDGAVLTGSEGNVQISGTGKSVMGHAGSAANEYECTVVGALVGKSLQLTFSCPAVMGGLKIEFKQGEIPAEIVVPGTYSGYTEAKSTYFSGMMADNQDIVVAKNADNTYKIDYVSDTWGTFTIENAAAAYADGVFTLKGDGVTKMGMDGNLKDYDCTVEATIDPEKEEPVFTFTVPSVMGGLTITFQQGDMPAAE